MADVKNFPPVYHAFEPHEMEALLAHVKGFQHIEVSVRSDDEHREIIGKKFIPLPPEVQEFELKRPLSPSERFLEAVKVFVVGKQIKFPNMKFHANDNTIEALGIMDGKRAKESARLYRALLDWDEEVLDACVNGRGGLINEKLGFGKHEAPPLTIETTISDLEFMMGETGKIGETDGVGTLASILKPAAKEKIDTTAGTGVGKVGRHRNDCDCEKCEAKRAAK